MNRSAVTLGILLLITVGLGAFLVWPKYQDWQLAIVDLQSIQGELDKLREVDSLVKNLEKAEPTLTQKTEQAKQIVPEQEEREVFVTQLDSLAKANNVILATFTFTGAAKKVKAADEPDAATGSQATPAKTAKAKTVKAVAIPLAYTAAVAGNFTNIEHFLSQMKQMSRYTDIQTFNLGGEDDKLNLQITGAIYSQPLPKIPTHLKFSTQAWDYLAPTLVPDPLTSTGRPDPFAHY